MPDNPIEIADLEPFDAADYLDAPESVSAYLNAALEGGDMRHFAKAVGTAAKAVGMTEMARRTGLSRENLYRRLDGKSVPKTDTLLSALSGLGLGLAVVPLDDNGTDNTLSS